MASVIVYVEPGRPGLTWPGMSTPYKKKPLPPIELRKDPKHGLWVWDRPKVKKPAKPGSFWMGANLQPGRIRMPGAHNLAKASGETVNITWEVTNTGQSPGISRLWLYSLGTGGLVAESPQVQIAEGATVPLSLSWPNNLPGGTNSMLVIMADQSPGATKSLAEHEFNITVMNPVNLKFISNSLTVLQPGGFFTWVTTVRNDEPSGGRSGMFVPTRSNTDSFGGPNIRRLTGVTLAPGQTLTKTGNTSTGATFVRGDIWVEEWTAGSGSVFVRELPGSRKPYNLVF